MCIYSGINEGLLLCLEKITYMKQQCICTEVQIIFYNFDTSTNTILYTNMYLCYFYTKT